ncbi:unnamed protein product [Rhizoctonia solani]|uniref:Uncharacterized protein n=1 Tax=Rhizoctonia solani TaxID=456999 RepID=A0A8H2XYE5_9AGAM|nr:unnamed protein product [Rhizoctonia solani]
MLGIVRAISEFTFLKNGQHITPTYDESTNEYWKGVKMQGYVASLSGQSRRHVMAGWWDIDAGDMHYVFMEINGIVGIFQEEHQTWRDGHEPILWVDTIKGYSYALQHPHNTYAEAWETAVASWAANHGQQSAGFQALVYPFDRPGWWPDGKDWEEFRAHTEKLIAAAKKDKAASRGGKSRQVATVGRRGKARGKAGSKARAERNKPSQQGEEEGTDADGEGETDNESGPMSGVGQSVARSATVGVRDKGEENNRSEHEAGEQLAEGQTGRIGTGKGKGKQAEGGRATRRAPRAAKAIAIATISARPLQLTTAHQEGATDPSSGGRDGGDAMQLDGEEFNQTPSSSLATQPQPSTSQTKSRPPSRCLTVPASVVPADWETRRALAARLAGNNTPEQRAPEEHYPEERAILTEPTEIRPDEGQRAESRSAQIQTAEPLEMETQPDNGRPPTILSQSDAGTQLALSSDGAGNTGGYDGDGSRNSTDHSGNNIAGAGSQALSPTVSQSSGAGAKRTLSASAPFNGKLRQFMGSVVDYRKTRAPMLERPYSMIFSDTATTRTVHGLLATNGNMITVVPGQTSLAPPAAPAAPTAPTAPAAPVATVTPGGNAQPVHPEIPIPPAPPITVDSLITSRTTADINEVSRNLQQTEFEGEFAPPLTNQIKRATAHHHAGQEVYQTRKNNMADEKGYFSDEKSYFSEERSHMSDGGNTDQPRRIAPANLKIKVTFNRAKDRYCYYCEDGGSIMDCNTCPRGYCYDIIGKSMDTTFQHTSNPEARPCVSVPLEMVEDKRRVFRCPECLSNNVSSLPDYIINRGSRATRRVSIKTSVALVVYYLKSYQETARALAKQLHAALAIFEIHVVPVLIKLNRKVLVSQAEVIRHHLLPRAPYHLAILFLTESDPRGGWWVMSSEERLGAFRVDEKTFINYHVETLVYLATDALTARVFPISCGLNLLNEDTLGDIFSTLNVGPWESIVLPTALSLLVKNYVSIFPELFVNLYYFGLPLRSSLLRTWAKSEEAREHTGFLVMERAAGRNKPFGVSKFEHAPNSRPFGIDLPMAPSVCGCWDKSPHHWSLRHSSNAFGERFSFYISSCCSLELHVAIYTDRRTVFNAHGTMIMEEKWDPASERFSFDPITMVCMKISISRKGKTEQAKRPKHTSPWTEAGAKGGNLVLS